MSPPDALASFVFADAPRMAADVDAASCSRVRLFVDRTSVEAYLGTDPRRYVVGRRELREAAEGLFRAAWA